MCVSLSLKLKMFQTKHTLFAAKYDTTQYSLELSLLKKTHSDCRIGDNSFTLQEQLGQVVGGTSVL